MYEVLTHTLTDPAYWIQCICAAIFAYYVLDFQRKDLTRPFVIAGKILFLVAAFFGIHFILSLLTFTYHILAGIGTWLAYLGGVVIFAVFIPRYDRNARIVTAAAACSSIITVFELGAVFGRFLEQTCPGFDSIFTKTAASLLLLAEGWVVGRYRLSRFYVSVHASLLNLASCVASTVSVIVFDAFSVHVFPRGGDVGISALMSVILLALFVINAVCYLMTFHLSREYTNVIDLTAETQMNKSAASLMAVTEENLTELHKIRHDIQNQYAYMRAMMDSGDYEGLRGYFDELTSTFAEPLGSMVDYGNHVLNLIFNMESAKARKMGVALDVKAAAPHQLPFSELDLVKLYTNVTDNAMEACVAEKCPSPFVTITVKVVGEYLFTQIKNPTEKKKSFLESGFPTTKGDARVHGKGTSIVRGIIRKYGGSIRYSIQDGEFIVEFMLCLKEVSNE